MIQAHTSPTHLRLFLASPGDLADERALALQTLEQLQYDPLLRGQITLEVVAWDKPGAGTPMLATLTPQTAIAQGLPQPADCDIVVVIFWSRIGTPLPIEYRKPDGSPYLSGTEWEFQNALKAAERQKKPKILVYRRMEKVLFDPDDPDFAEKHHQWQGVKTFFASFANADGSLRRGYNEYTTPSQFQRDLSLHLRDLIKRHLEHDDTIKLRAANPSPATPTLPLWEGSPFPGLRAFGPDDAPIFFGRGRETDELIGKLNNAGKRFLAVVGSSGSGKSSLVAAGLWPRLNAGAIQGSRDWEWVRFTPGEVGDNPFMALTVQFDHILGKRGERPRDRARKLMSEPATVAEFVSLALAGKPAWAELILFIDQFEELFTLVNPPYRDPFLKLLTAAVTTPRMRLILTLRADFYVLCVEHQVLAELLQKSSYPLGAPGIGALHDMITLPVARAGLTFEDGLPEQILSDTGSEPGALPLLAFALAELYDSRTAEGCLTHEAYARFKGVHGAIGQRAQSVFDQLSPTSQAALGTVLWELVEVDDRGTATRRRGLLSSVASSESASLLVEALTGARLLVQGKGENDKPVVEVAHEALLRIWKQAVDWVEQAREDLSLRRKLQTAALEWEEQGHNEAYRWSDERVVDTRNILLRTRYRPSELEQRFLGPLDPEAMVAKLDEPMLSHAERALLGVRLSLLGDPRPGTGLREDGVPDILWCDVPGGEITLTFDLSMLPGAPAQTSSHVFPVAPCRISKYLISYRQYRAFIDAEDGYKNPEWWTGLAHQFAEPGRQWQPRDNHPVENLAWIEAVAFCRWLSVRLGCAVRLPTEWEWQQAATGGNPAHIYPWGAEWDMYRANTFENGLNRTTAVGLYPQGAAPAGAMDMSGNVWEQCLNEFLNPSRVDVSGLQMRAVRGGSWNHPWNFATVAARMFYPPNLRAYVIGFRLLCSR